MTSISKTIIRDIRLSEITGTKLNKDTQKVVDHYNNIFKDMTCYYNPSTGTIHAWSDTQSDFLLIQHNSESKVMLNKKLFKISYPHIVPSTATALELLTFLIRRELPKKIKEKNIIIGKACFGYLGNYHTDDEVNNIANNTLKIFKSIQPHNKYKLIPDKRKCFFTIKDISNNHDFTISCYTDYVIVEKQATHIKICPVSDVISANYILEESHFYFSRLQLLQSLSNTIKEHKYTNGKTLVEANIIKKVHNEYKMLTKECLDLNTRISTIEASYVFIDIPHNIREKLDTKRDELKTLEKKRNKVKERLRNLIK